MGEYTYLDDLPEGESGDFGTAAYRDVGTEGDEVPDNDILDARLAGLGGGGGVINAFRVITSTGSFTTLDATTQILFILIGAGAGGSAKVSALGIYGEGFEGSYGGGAGGVTVGLASVSSGVSLAVTIGSGGDGGDAGSSDYSWNSPRYGSFGGNSIFLGYTSAGGGQELYNETVEENINHPEIGGIGTGSDDEDILWAKQGGYGSYVTAAGDGELQQGGTGGSPWGGTPVSDKEEMPHYSYQYSIWRGAMQGLTARYGHGGAGAEDDGVDGYAGGDGILIAVELA